MAEILILLKVLRDILELPAWWSRGADFPLVRIFLASATLWSGLQLVLALLLSVPPVNTLLHGTHAVTAHAMGSMVGIDSMALWAFFAYLWSRDDRSIAARLMPAAAVGANLFLLLQWTALLANGVGRGAQVYTGASAGWYEVFRSLFPRLFAVAGAGLASCIGVMALHWSLSLRGRWRRVADA